MKRPRKDAAELLDQLSAEKSTLEARIGDAKKLVESKRKAVDQRRQKILAEACLSYFADPTLAKNARTIESELMKKMKDADNTWYRENPHQLIAADPPPGTAQVTTDTPKSSGTGETGGGSTVSGQPNQGQA